MSLGGWDHMHSCAQRCVYVTRCSYPAHTTYEPLKAHLALAVVHENRAKINKTSTEGVSYLDPIEARLALERYFSVSTKSGSQLISVKYGLVLFVPLPGIRRVRRHQTPPAFLTNCRTNRRKASLAVHMARYHDRDAFGWSHLRKYVGPPSSTSSN